MMRGICRFSVWCLTLLFFFPFHGNGLGAEGGVTDNTILVGCSNSFSGPLNYSGVQTMQYGMDPYFKHINEQGGVHGRKILTKYYDDGLVPQNAVANTKRLVERDGVFAILAPHGTAPVMATVKYLSENKVPLLFALQGSPIEGKTIFSSFIPYPTQSDIVITWLVKKKRFKRIGILYQDDAYGHTFRDPAKELLERMGLELVAAESYKRTAVDLSAQVVKLREAKLDACLLVATHVPAAAFLREAEKIGWKGTKFISCGPLTDETFLELSGGIGEGIWGLSIWPDPRNSQAPGVVEYREVLKKYERDNKPNRYSIYGYFYAKLFAEGLKRAGRNVTREGYIAALEGMKNWESGIVPPVSFSETDHLAQDSGFMAEVKGGAFRPITGWLKLEKGKLSEEPLQE